MHDGNGRSFGRNRILLSEPPENEHERGNGPGMPVFDCRCSVSARGKVTEKIESGPMGRDVFTYGYDASGHLTEVRKNELLWE